MEVTHAAIRPAQSDNVHLTELPLGDTGTIITLCNRRVKHWYHRLPERWITEDQICKKCLAKFKEGQDGTKQTKVYR